MITENYLIDFVQGQDDRDNYFGYVAGDDGGFFFTWLPTLEATIESVEEDQQDGDGGLCRADVQQLLRRRLPATKRGAAMWGGE